jgi:hypothetical protein
VNTPLINTFTTHFRKGGYTVLFYSLWVLQAWVAGYDLQLKEVINGQIGQGTLDGLDLAARNTMFYSGGLLFMVSLFVFSGLYLVLHNKVKQFSALPEWGYVNAISAGGVLVMVAGFFGARADHSLECVYLLHKLFLLISVVNAFVPRRRTALDYTVSVLLALSAYFLLAIIYSLARSVKMPDLYMWLFVFSFIALMANDRWSLSSPKKMEVLFPLLWMPLLFIFSEEYYLTLRFKGIPDPSRVNAIAVMFFVLAFWMWQKNKRQNERTSEYLLMWRWMPATVFSLVAYGTYSYYAEYGFQERFETGNKFLPLMEYALYGTISPLEKFNTHLLSDYFFGAFYLFVNGLQGNEMDLYDFLLYPFSALLYYLLFATITRSAYIALFLALFFPFASNLFPIGFMAAVLPLFAFKLVVRDHPKRKHYLIFSALVVFTMLWRLEFTYATLLLLPLFLTYLAFSETGLKVEFKRIALALAGGIFSTMLLVAVLAYVREVPIAERLAQVIHYLSSVQSYGMSSIGNASSTLYKMHYFVFPVLVLMLFALLLTRMVRKELVTMQPWSVLSLFYLCLFYLANFQRGITRHSLQEGTDAFVSTFVYILVLTAPFVFYQKSTSLFRMMYMGFAGIVLATNFTLPLPVSVQSGLECSFKKIADSHPVNLYYVDDRVKKKEKPDATQPVVSFFNQHLKADETFLDFSNNPLLYFLSRKPTPAYFYQNPLCVHDAFLQEAYIQEAKNYKAPFVVFSQYHTQGMDEIDGVPNCVRHYHVAEWLYKHYAPFVLKGPFCVWKDRRLQWTLDVDTLLNVSLTDTQQVAVPINRNANEQVFIYTAKNVLPQLFCKAQLPQVLTLNDTTHMLRLNAEDSIDIAVSNARKVVVLSGEDEPDMTQEAFQKVDLKQLPMVWGREAGIEKWPTAFKEQVNLDGNKGIAYTFKQSAFKRHTGAYVLLKVASTAKQRGQLFLFFGKKGDDNQNVIVFDTPAKTGDCWLAVRTSMLYNWHKSNMNQLALWSDRAPGLVIKEVRLVYE